MLKMGKIFFYQNGQIVSARHDLNQKKSS